MKANKVLAIVLALAVASVISIALYNMATKEERIAKKVYEAEEQRENAIESEIEKDPQYRKVMGLDTDQAVETVKADEDIAREAVEEEIQGSVHAQITAYVPELDKLTYVDTAGTEHVFNIETAFKAAELQKGLMFRHELPADQGMLFVFPKEADRTFWMKNTFIPLDMFFIKSDGTIHSIHKGAIPQDTTLIPSNGPVQFVLETNAGVADKYGIKAGDKFLNENFQK